MIKGLVRPCHLRAVPSVHRLPRCGWGPYMRSRRRLLIGAVVVAVAVLLGCVVLLRKLAPPEPARLLPSADAFVYADARWLHRTGESLPAIERTAEYSRFVAETGIDPERDLDEAALALHYPAASVGPAAPPTNTFPAEKIRFSTVLRGRIQMDRLGTYLARVSASHQEYRGITIYALPLENRTLRVALLGTDLVATSNVDDPLVIRGIIDRSKKLASPFAGPQMLRQYYREIPLTSMAWGIFRTDRLPNQQLSLGGPFSGSLIGGSVAPQVMVASVRYFGSWALHAQAFMRNDAEAQKLSGEWNATRDVLAAGLAPSAAGSAGSGAGGDAGVEAGAEAGAENTNARIAEFLQSSKIEASGRKVTISATLPSALWRALVLPAVVTPVAPLKPEAVKPPRSSHVH